MFLLSLSLSPSCRLCPGKKKFSKVVSLPLNYFDYKTKTLQENSFQTCSVKLNELLSRFLKEKFDRSIYRFNLRFEGYFSGQKKGRGKKKSLVSLCGVAGFVRFLCIVLYKVLCKATALDKSNVTLFREGIWGGKLLRNMTFSGERS